MKIKSYTLGAWFNHKRFNQRKAKGYTLSKRFDHRLSRLLSWLLFKLLPSRWYLRTQGTKPYHEPSTIVTITYFRIGKKHIQEIKLAGGGSAAIKMLPLWFKHGFLEPFPKISSHHFYDKDLPTDITDYLRYYIPPSDILKVKWYDPVLEDYFSIDNLGHGI